MSRQGQTKYAMGRARAPRPRERTVMERVLGVVDYPSSLVRRALTGSDAPLPSQAFERWGVPGAVLGSIAEAVLDPLNLASAGVAGGAVRLGKNVTRTGRGVALSTKGAEALRTATQAEHAALLARQARRPASVGSKLAPEAAAQLATRRAQRSVMERVLGGAEDLVDRGGLKVGLPFGEHRTVVSGEQIARGARSLADRTGLTFLAKEAAASPAGQRIRELGGQAAKLFSRRTTPVSAAQAAEEDLARYASAQGVEVAKRRALEEVALVAKALGRDPNELLRDIYRALERPHDTELKVDLSKVRGTNAERKALEDALARTQRLAGEAVTGSGRWAKRGAVTSPTSPVEVANPKRAQAEARVRRIEQILESHPWQAEKAAGEAARAAGEAGARAPKVSTRYLDLLQRIERAKGQVQGLPQDLRRDLERRLAKIRADVTRPRVVAEKPVPEPESWGVGSRMVWHPEVKGSSKRWPFTVEVLGREPNGQVLVRVSRVPKGRNLPAGVTRYRMGEEMYLPAEALAVPDATRSGRIRGAERKSLPKELRPLADEMERAYREAAYELHDQVSGRPGLATMHPDNARSAGPGVYREWLEARSEALARMDSEMGTDGGLISRANAVDRAIARVRGEDPAKVAAGALAPGPTVRRPDFRATPKYRGLARVREFLAKRQRKLEGHVAGLEEEIRRTPPVTGLEPVSPAGRALEGVADRLGRHRSRLEARSLAAAKKLMATPEKVTVQQPNILGRLLEREKKIRARLGQLKPGEETPALARLKPAPEHPELDELRPRVERTGQVDRLDQLPAEVRPLARRLRQELEGMHSKEQVLSRPTPALGTKELEYVPHILTDAGRKAIRQAHTDPMAAQAAMRRMTESHASMRPREFVENIVVDGRRYENAVGRKAPGQLTDQEALALAEDGIIHRRYMSAEEINRKAAAGELEILGAQWETVKDASGRESRRLIRPGIQVKEFVSENPLFAVAVRRARHERAMAGHRFVQEMKRGEYGGRQVGEGGAMPDGYAFVAKPGLEGWAFPAPTAREIDAVMQKFETPEEISELGKAFDRLMGLWKGWQLATPGYHIRNQVSDMVAMNLAGLDWRDMPRRIAQGFDVARGKAGSIDTPGGAISYEAIREMGERLGVTGGQYGAELEQDLARALEGPAWRKVSRWLTPGDRSNILAASRDLIGKPLEDSRRFGLFADRLARGETPEVAAAHVRRYMIDYGDLTEFERARMKRAMPFYTYPRRAVQAYVGELLKRPSRLSNILHVKHGVEAASGGPEPDRRFLSEMIRDELGVRVKYRAPGHYEFLLLGKWLPYGVVLDLAQPISTSLDMLTPLVKTGSELYTGKRFGTDKDIVSWEGQPGSFLGVHIPRAVGGWKTERVLRSIAFLNMVDKLVPGQPHRMDPGSPLARVAGALLGTVAQPMDIEKGRRWYIYDLQRKLSRARAAYDKAMAGGYTKEAEEIAGPLERMAAEREELGPMARPKASGERPSAAFLRAAGLDRR